MPPGEDVIEKKSMNQDDLLSLAKEDNPEIDYIDKDKLISSVMFGNKMKNEILNSILKSLKVMVQLFKSQTKVAKQKKPMKMNTNIFLQTYQT